MADHIQIGDIAPRIQYAANGAQTQFTYPFPIFVAADLEVYLGAVKQTSGFTVAGAGASAGGSVTFTAAPANGTTVTLRRNIAIKRMSDFQESGEFRAKVINDELDYQTAALQQVADDAARAVRLSPTDTAADLMLPLKADRADKFLACDADGHIIGAAGAAGVPVSAFAATLLDDADAAAARATLGLVIGTNVLALNGDGSALTNLPLDATLASDIRLIALDTAALKGDRLNMVNGWADPLKDETDIETAQNVNATFVAGGGGYYHNPSTPVQISTTGKTLIGDMTSNGGLAAAFDGNTNQNSAASAWKGGGTDIGYVGVDWGAGNTKTVVGYKSRGSSDFGFLDGAAGATVTLTLQGSTDNFSGSIVDLHTDSFTDTDNNTEKSYLSGITAGAYRYHRLRIQRTAGLTGYNIACCELELYEVGSPPDMTVVSKQVVVAASAPTVGRLHVQIKDITGGSSVNTDFKGYVSRDNGTTYTLGALALVQMLADGTKAYEFDSLDISAQPSGTAPRFKFTTHNAKQIELHGAVVQWK